MTKWSLKTCIVLSSFDKEGSLYCDHKKASVLAWKQELRVAVCKDRESAVSDPFGESLIFCPKLALGRLFSKIIFKSSNDFVYLSVKIEKNEKCSQNAVRVRFFGWSKGAMMNLRRSLKMNSVDLKITRISKQSIFYTTNVLIFSNMIVQWFFRPFRKHLRRPLPIAAKCS